MYNKIFKFAASTGEEDNYDNKKDLFVARREQNKRMDKQAPTIK
jgi:hypothetical protein